MIERMGLPHFASEAAPVVRGEKGTIWRAVHSQTLRAFVVRWCERL